MRRPSPDGFTLIELMIVVAIIGIMAAIAIPQFANMVAKAQEGATKGNLGALRSALSLYYSDNEGLVDGTPDADLIAGGRYIAVIPKAYFPTTPNNIGHPAINRILDYNFLNLVLGADLLLDSATANYGGGFIYDGGGYSGDGSLAVGSDPSDPLAGQIFCFCVHSDLKGNPWYSN